MSKTTSNNLNPIHFVFIVASLWFYPSLYLVIRLPAVRTSGNILVIVIGDGSNVQYPHHVMVMGTTHDEGET